MRKRSFWAEMAARENFFAMEALALSIAEDEMPADALVDQRDGYCNRCETHHVLNTHGSTLKHHRYCPKAMKPTLTIMFEGKEGRSTRSPFGGHDNWGGNKFSKLTGLKMINIQTQEHGTSCTCGYCGHRLVKGRRSVVRDGKIIAFAVNGVLECRNPDCPALQNGYALRKRDGESGNFLSI